MTSLVMVRRNAIVLHVYDSSSLLCAFHGMYDLLSHSIDRVTGRIPAKAGLTLQD